MCPNSILEAPATSVLPTNTSPRPYTPQATHTHTRAAIVCQGLRLRGDCKARQRVALQVRLALQHLILRDHAAQRITMSYVEAWQANGVAARA